MSLNFLQNNFIVPYHALLFRNSISVLYTHNVVLQAVFSCNNEVLSMLFVAMKYMFVLPQHYILNKHFIHFAEQKNSHT